ncbi:MAG: serine aminopeptidase domain-containing protein [Jiangellaceae bacterium]
MGELVARGSTVAERVDDELGVREEVEFFGGTQRVFGCRHLPVGAVAGGLVVCSPILSDFGANYLREVRLARRLAASGVAVQRFHPRGSGHSDGDRLDLTLDSMADDAAAAVERLRQRCGVSTVALLGTRFGALVAAAAARELVSAPVVLWEPVTDPSRYFREGLRARSVHHLRRGTRGGDEPEAELATQGYVDVLGIPVGRELFETPASRGLAASLGPAARPLLLVQLDSREDLKRPYREAVDRWAAEGLEVTATCCPTEETWWFMHDRLTPTETLVDTTAEWLLDRLGGDD